MVFLLILGFVAAFCVIAWSAVQVLIMARLGGWGVLIYWAILMATVIAAAWSTYFYDYYLDENTHVNGWPVPMVIFQRQTPDGPWLDFVGPITLFSGPMNFILYMILPAIVFLVTVRLRRAPRLDGGQTRGSDEPPLN